MYSFHNNCLIFEKGCTRPICSFSKLLNCRFRHSRQRESRRNPTMFTAAHTSLAILQPCLFEYTYWFCFFHADAIQRNRVISKASDSEIQREVAHFLKGAADRCGWRNDKSVLLQLLVLLLPSLIIIALTSSNRLLFWWHQFVCRCLISMVWTNDKGL